MTNLEDYNLWMNATKVPFPSTEVAPSNSATGMPGRLQSNTPQSAPTRNAVRITQHIQTSRQSLFSSNSSIPLGQEVSLCSPPPNWSVKSFSKACTAAPAPIKIDAPPPFGEPPVLLETKHEAADDIARPADTIGIDEDWSPTQKPSLSLRSRKGLPWSPPSKDKPTTQSLGLLGDSIWRVGEKDFELSNFSGPSAQPEIEHIRMDIEKIITDKHPPTHSHWDQNDVAVAWADGAVIQGKPEYNLNNIMNQAQTKETPLQSISSPTVKSPVRNTNTMWNRTPEGLRNIQQQLPNRPIPLIYPSELSNSPVPSSAPTQLSRQPISMSRTPLPNYYTQDPVRNEIATSTPSSVIPQRNEPMPKRPPAPIGPFDIPAATANNSTRRSSNDQRFPTTQSTTSSTVQMPFSLKAPTTTPNRTTPADQRPISAPLFSIPQQYDVSKKVMEAPSNIIWTNPEADQNSDRAPVAYVAVPVYSLGSNTVSPLPTSSSINSLTNENEKPKERRFPICEGGRCPHKAFWSRLRAKRGYSYFVCHQCGLEWRTPSRAEKERQLRKLQEIESACDGEDDF